MVDHEVGKPSQTDWQVLEEQGTATSVRLFPRTGRSHQLRVHMLALGHPILGDRLYAHADAFSAADRLMLHAESLTLRHPVGGKEMKFTAATPFEQRPF
jgi:tRNA pseudouridine32 synthase/23S rRNA pseudouridine746 synthase